MSRVTGSRLSDVPDRLFEPEVVVGFSDVDWRVLWRGGLDWGLRVLLPEERELGATVGKTFRFGQLSNKHGSLVTRLSMKLLCYL